ncbi:carboxypeptidase regulatory-like domain-containing protein [Vandammella animalimorsus]|uniref:carboxypeptidase regulatory-like domain-containing protein n=1 Tax=Vandammella animalimorsus TaxID=2029117 RepID=UPI0031BA1D21
MGAHGWAQTPAPADAALQRGATWLQAQIQPDGRLASEPACAALPLQARSETARTLKALAMQPLPPALLGAIDSPAANTTEYLARQAMARQQAGTADAALLDALIALQNTDGSFGAAAGHPGNPQDTAWALHALAASRASGAAAAQALGWLTAVQQADGAWPLMPDGDAIVSTALAVQALTPYRQQPTAREALAKARAWLTAQRDASQSWGSDLRTAQALLAVLPGLDTAAGMQAPLAALRQSQRSDGSWAGDPHLSALALHALWLAGQPATNPDLASVQGRLLDAQTRAPLAGFAVRLQGPADAQATADATGAFGLTGLVAGNYTLSVPAQGEFLELRAQLVLAQGQKLDVGSILLNRTTQPSTATVLGTVTHADTGAPLEGVAVSAAGLTTTTAADGSYQMLNVPPGDLDLLAGKAGFRRVAGKVRLQAGETAIFSPALKPLPAGGAPQGEISGIVSDILSGQAIAAAEVAVTGAFSATVQTDAAGRYRISPLAQAGEIQITVTAAGYQQASGAAVVAVDSALDFSPRLVRAGAAPGTGKIHGVVLDADTAMPLEGALIRAGSLTATSNQDGSYLIDHVPAGAVRLTASLPGYASAWAEGAMIAGGLLEFSPRLSKATAALTASAIFGTVTQQKNGQPVAGAQVYASGVQSHSALTDAQGRYRIEGLAEGNYSVTISHDGLAAATVNFDLPARTEMDFSPMLSESGASSVVIPNSATLSGRLIDSVTQQPIETATYRLEGQTRERGVNRLGRFNILGVHDARVSVVFSAPGYHPLQVQLPVTPLLQQDVGDLHMQRIVAARLPDLAIARFDVSSLQSDPDTLQLSGQVQVEVINQGAQDVSQPFSVLVFEDVNRTGSYEPAQDRMLGKAQVQAGLPIGQLQALDIAVGGQLRFRDAPLALWLDSEHQVVELDEANNLDGYGTTAQQAAKLYDQAQDFAEGRRINVAVNGAGTALQLAEHTRAFDNIWIANSGRGTILKVSIATGAVLGEYHSAPQGMGKNPSRTTVDKNGNVWVGNRNESSAVEADAIAPGLPVQRRPMGSIVKIGLLENGQCEDRNGNGVIDTSTGLGDLRNWSNAGDADRLGGVATAEDECILAYARVNSAGTRHISVDRRNQVWVSGTGGRHFDLVDEQGRIVRQESSVGWGGYGGLIDANDVIWSSSGGWGLLRWDVQHPLSGPNGVHWHGMSRGSYGLCIDSRGNVWDSRGSVYRPDGSLLRTYAGGHQGCAVDDNDNVWVATGSYVNRYTNEGVFVGAIQTGGTTGLSTDANGYVWAVGGSRYQRIDPAAGAVGADGLTPIGAIDIVGPDLGPGTYLYNYSDMTGSTLSGKPQQGTWTAVYDSQRAATPWGMIDWHAQALGDGQLTVTASSSEDCQRFSPPVAVVSGQALAQVPAGRCLQVSVHFRRASTGESPVLYDLKIRPAVPDLTAGQIQAVDAGAGQVALQATIGNASPFNAGAFEVAFWRGQPGAGGALLGAVPIASMAAGQHMPVRLPGIDPSLLGLGELVTIHADSADAHAEYNEDNNTVAAPLRARNLLAAISVATDQPVYPSQSPVQLSALVRNLGSFDAALSVALQVRDAQGQSVAQFPPHALGQVAAGAQTPHSQAWHTGALSAGGYTLHGQALAPDGQVLAQAFTPFAIAASGPGAPAAALGVATDRAQYSPDDRVRIDALARNLTANAAIDDARIALEVHGPQGQLIASHTLPVGQLAAGALRAADVLQPLRQAPLGAYTIAATLIGSGRFHGSAVQDVALASASARFEVVAQGGPGPGPSPGAQADYSIRKSAPQPAIATGGQARWVITVANQGPHDGHGVLIEDALPAGLTQAQWTCSASGQARCGRASGQGPVQLDALIPSGAGHAVTIVVTATAPAAGTLDNTARISALGGSIDANSTNNQASARIAVTGPAPTPGPAPGPGPTPNPGATPGTPPVPVPVGAPWAIIGLLALLLAAHPASRAARRPAARQPHCKNKKP